MKIFFIGQKGIPATSGGVENHVENLALNLAESGHEVFAYTRHSYSDKKIKSYKNIKLIPLPSISGKNLDAISHTFLACLDFIFRRKADIVHFHSIGPASLSWLIKIFRPRTRIVFTFHSQCYYNTKWGKLAKFYLMFGERVGCKIANKVIVVSKNLKEYTENKYKRRAKYIPNGVNPINIMDVNKIRERWGLEKNSYILSVSRVVRNKGLEYLVDAYKQIKTDKKLLIVGDGDFSKKLKERAGDNPNIIFTGNQSGDILNELFSNAALFVQASEAEGLSIALLEAMSAKLPIIASNISANKDVVGPDAFLFENKSVVDLRSKINLMINENDRHSIDKSVKNNYNKVLRSYNWEGIVKEVLNVYYS